MLMGVVLQPVQASLHARILTRQPELWESDHSFRTNPEKAVAVFGQAPVGRWLKMPNDLSNDYCPAVYTGEHHFASSRQATRTEETAIK
jgi:hypothetical protein